MFRKSTAILSFVVSVYISGCDLATDHVINPAPAVSIFATGLTAPLGVEADAEGRLWVTEAGDGQSDDGQLSMISATGEVFTVVTGFTSRVSPEGGVFGLNHLVLQNGILWMLHGVEGRLYQFDISTFQPGDAPMQASELKYEDVSTFVKNHDFENDTDTSDLFNLTVGPDGDLFIVDAGANAVIRRKASTKELSVFSTIPPIANPGGEPDQLEPVPTGIVFDGQKFLICNFSGYPFPAKKSPIYQVDLNGNTSVYQTGLSSATDIELGEDQKPVVIEYGSWTGETFAENSGTIMSATNQAVTPLLSGLNFPNSIKRSGSGTYFVAQTFDGVIKKVVF
ncbi:ScyD/ScyE family protein [Dyadobacter sediminis]|nr:ScyD/ScyE family protein [Dyadobacter sediminis]GGB95389.1 hypothetical protein GCM10011325_23450 [Dyadobacter sediminis]